MEEKEKTKELNFDDLRFKYSEEEYEYICDSCKEGFDNIRPQKYTSYDEDGEIIKEEWATICPSCNAIIEG